MKEIRVQGIRSDKIYDKIMNASVEKKDDIYRYDLMKPFEGKWSKYHCPLKARQEGGYDVVMASGMLGYLLPQQVDETKASQIAILSDETFWKQCEQVIKESFQRFEDGGILLPLRDYLYTIVLQNEESPYAKMSDNYSGDGGIPGYIFGACVPSKETMKRLPFALAHEVNHNVRFQFITWSNDITLGEYMVLEGLAENFVACCYGEEKVGPWVTKTDMETLNEYIKPLMKEALSERGFENISSYMYGDELSAMQHYFPVGMPYCAGYACGYHLIRYYLKKTGKSIVEATILPAEEIMKEVEDFWEN